MQCDTSVVHFKYGATNAGVASVGNSTVCCCVLQRVAASCSMLQRVVMCSSALQYVTWCVAVSCSVLLYNCAL